MLKYLLFLYTLFGWIPSDILIRLIYVMWICAMIMHWLTRNNECSLILAESYIRNKRKEDTYMYKNLSPFFELDKFV